MLYPTLDVDGGVFVVGVADYNGGNACVDYHSLAHGAWLNIAVKLTCFCVVTGKVNGSINGVASGGGNDGVCLGMNASAQFIALTLGDIQLFTGAVAQIAAVQAASGSAHIACGNYLVIFYDYSAEIPAQAGASFKNGLGDIKVIVYLVSSGYRVQVHKNAPLLKYFHKLGNACGGSGGR